MRSIRIRSFGGPEVVELTERPVPEPRPGEVLVRVAAAAVNPADWRIRAGEVRRLGEPPLGLGLDVAGTVVAGDGGRFRTGDRVFGVVPPPQGSFAEYVAVPGTTLARTPDELDDACAAALPVAGLTAWQALVAAAHLGSGERVLVHAGAGGIGHLAVQIARARGAHVTATAGTANQAFLRELGVDEPVDHRATDVFARPDRFDVVLDPLGGAHALRSLELLRPGGRLVDVRGTGVDRTALRTRAAQLDVELTELYFRPDPGDLDALALLAAKGDLRPHLGLVLPLERAAEAIAEVESGHARGKVVLSVAAG
ncbi:NADP-dependent oxidoreductase [Streptacidiphilus jiangxiensis]|uniref:NADPH:quinone reductase n=1 Tax=Streptacidiphilus jiangxiensis TaxID=235985 RepID=A0A1H7WZB9_STRJI|nr:NADP-dependent oxidoreductase [Streptacidiphilus jiangxiensis]SEM26976.1 NADPH:quinone reductase [Streptacidiphilus jiangxiensis]